MAISTVRKGRDEAREGAKPEDVVKVRRSTGKRPFEIKHPEVWPALEKLVDPVTRGDPNRRCDFQRQRGLASRRAGHGIRSRAPKIWMAPVQRLHLLVFQAAGHHDVLVADGDRSGLFTARFSAQKQTQ
jgi:hypothetical protein